MITVSIKGIEMNFNTKPTLFSPNYVDAGTLAMLSLAEFKEGDKLLDLGCGYGVVGILAAKIIGAENVVMTDIDEVAVSTAVQNAKINGVSDIKAFKCDGFTGLDDAGFTMILSNPPYHTDFSVAKRFIEKGFNRLKVGGKMLMVTKRKEWYKNKFISVFGGVTIHEIGGYYVFAAEKRGTQYSKLSKKSQHSDTKKMK